MKKQESQPKELCVEWKVSTCSQGVQCWCRMVEPKEKIIDIDGNDVYIIGSGNISEIHANYIVNLHNNALQNSAI